MTSEKIMIDIIGEDFLRVHKDDTCDTMKAGKADNEVSKIGTCLVATPDVIRAAAAWGADLLITHEPTYYNFADVPDDTAQSKMKHKLICDGGFTIWRYHDSMHFGGDDRISLAFLEKMGWKGTFDGQLEFVLDEPKSPEELAHEAGKGLGLCHPRIIGARGGKVTKIGLYLGQRGDKCYENFMKSETELCFSGEICEWYNGEPVRDAGQLGIQKTIVVLGHAGSERLGMEYLARDIDKKYDGAEAKYFDCGELYSY